MTASSADTPPLRATATPPETPQATGLPASPPSLQSLQSLQSPQAEGTASTTPLRRIGGSAPFRWLAAGARDLRAAWPVSLFFGGAFWCMAVLVGLVFRGMPQYTMTLISGCFLVGPFLAMGLYESSRRHESGLPQDLAASLTCWDRRMGSMAMLVLVLLVLELVWGRASLVVFALFFDAGMPTTTGVVQALLSPENLAFVLVYVLVGAVFAALAFGFCAISIPMILDRDTDAVTAALRSLQLVLSQPGVMLLWGALIVALTLGAIALPWACGLLVVAPWLGHATWHAYRSAAEPVMPA